MNKFKEVIFVLITLVMGVVAIPLLFLVLISGIILYGICRVEAGIVCEINDDEVTDSWNEFVTAYRDASSSAGEAFLMEMELD